MHVLITDEEEGTILDTEADGILISVIEGDRVQGGAVFRKVKTSEVANVVASSIFLVQDLMDKDEYLAEFIDEALADAKPTWTRKMKRSDADS